MWVRRDDWGHLWGRVADLEAAQRDSVSGDVYRASLARIAELERRNDWAMDMLLRRGASMPVPPVKTEGASAEPSAPEIPETLIAQAEAIVAEGKRLNMGAEQIAEAVRSQTGLTQEALAAAVGGRVV